MDWQEVKSSQIAAVGYDAETETLGIRFKPTKKQEEDGERGSEYHYSNVDELLYQGIVKAESAGKAFAQFIKAYPAKYPFTKVA